MAVINSVNEKMKAIYMTAMASVATRKPSVPALAQP
jgi:hypothetical protein